MREPGRQLQDAPRRGVEPAHPPGSHRVNQVDHLTLCVEKKHVNGDSHEKRVHGVAGHQMQPLARGELRLAHQADEPTPEALGPLHVFAQQSVARVVGDAVAHAAVQPTLKLPALDAPLTLVLVSPQIPPNTGNVARLCACSGARLVLVEPLGFSISDKELKRAGLDYWDKVYLRSYTSFDAYVEQTPGARRWLFSARAQKGLWDVQFSAGDHLVFGSETTGLSASVLEGGYGDAITIPMLEDRRSLNLSTAVGIGTYEALRQLAGTPGRLQDLQGL